MGSDCLRRFLDRPPNLGNFLCLACQGYDLMEFLHTYGVKVNSADAQGRTFPAKQLVRELCSGCRSGGC